MFTIKMDLKFIFSLKFIPLTINGKVSGVYGVAKDITKAKSEYDELQRSNNQFKSFLNHNARSNLHYEYRRKN